MKRSMRWLMAGWVLCAVMGMGQGTESRFFRIQSTEPVEITGIADGVITWEGQEEGEEVTVEVSENLADPSGWRRYTGIPGDESRGSVRVFDRNTPQGMVLIPGGTNSGTNPLADGESYAPWYPETYSLTVESFYMDATPVTKAQWDEVYNWAIHADRGENIYTFDNAGSGRAPDHPVKTVNWYDVVKWCNARSEKEGRTPVYSIPGQSVYRSGRPSSHTDVVQTIANNGYRLPTVTEHQYASRGGLVGKRFPWGDTVTHIQANYCSHSSYSYDISPTRGFHPTYPYTSPVGLFAANGYGLYDMSGNVWEWCWGPVGSYRDIRGGSWYSSAFDLRCGIVYSSSPDNAYPVDGFRAVCRVEEGIFVRLSGNLDFGDVMVESSTTRTLTIHNDGDSTLTVSSISYPDGFSGNWSGTIGPGLSEQVEVVFAPQREQVYGGDLTVVSNADSGISTLSVSGTGVAETSIPAGMVLIPGGTNAGTNPLADDESYSEWYPTTYSLTVDSFYMDRTPVTKAHWDEVRGWGLENGYTDLPEGGGNGPDHPVHTVDWYDVVKWCNARSEMNGRTPVYTMDGNVYRTGLFAVHGTSPDQSTTANGYRLPTAIEWEYAARGGLVGKRFPWGDTINHSHANYQANGSAYMYDTSPYATSTFHPIWATGDWQDWPYTSPVASFAANGYGLYDMAGNVSEWCWGSTGSTRPLRGGNWFLSAEYLRCGSAIGTAPDLGEYDIGFRTICRGHVEESVIIGVTGELSFGEVLVGESVVQNFEIYNDGTGDLTVTDIDYPGGFSGDWSGTIAPGGSRNVAVTFSPTEGLTYIGQIIVHSDATSGTNMIVVSGIGIEEDAGPSPFVMVQIPGGTNAGTDPDYVAYSLTVRSFYMDTTPVTKAQWDEVYNWAITRGYSFDNAGSGKAANHPVQMVSWYDVVKWCNARSEKEGRTPVYTVSGNVYRTGSFGWDGSHVVNCDFNANGYRLPTVTEHQYASRGGLVGRMFPWGDTINHSHANYRANGSAYTYDTSPYTTWTYHPTYNDGTMPYTSPVGSFAANGYGLYDMAGNVWEWCWDPSGPSRDLRGGGWNYSAGSLRCGNVSWIDPDFAYYSLGFRAVCR